MHTCKQQESEGERESECVRVSERAKSEGARELE